MTEHFGHTIHLDDTHRSGNTEVIDIQSSAFVEGGLFIRLRSEDHEKQMQGHITHVDLAMVLPHLVALVEDNKPVLPTKPAAVIHAATRDGHNLVLRSEGDGEWTQTNALYNEDADSYYREGEIVSFEVLFEGVDA